MRLNKIYKCCPKEIGILVHVFVAKFKHNFLRKKADCFALNVFTEETLGVIFKHSVKLFINA